jgi:hypothetical protein
LNSNSSPIKKKKKKSESRLQKLKGRCICFTNTQIKEKLGDMERDKRQASQMLRGGAMPQYRWKTIPWLARQDSGHLTDMESLIWVFSAPSVFSYGSRPWLLMNLSLLFMQFYMFLFCTFQSYLTNTELPESKFLCHVSASQGSKCSVSTAK